MKRFLRLQRERGQTAVEFAIILTALFILTGGLASVGIAFYRYNAVASAARFGARWGGVEGGSCAPTYVTYSNDWCDQNGAMTSTNFWNQYGNKPLQTFGNACPTDIKSTFTGYYYNDVNPDGSVPAAAQQVSTYANSNATTIVGAIIQRFDTSTSGRNVVGSAISGFELSKLKVCIQTTWDPSSTTPVPGDRVKVFVYYPYTPLSGFFGAVSFNLNGESEYEIE